MKRCFFECGKLSFIVIVTFILSCNLINKKPIIRHFLIERTTRYKFHVYVSEENDTLSQTCFSLDNYDTYQYPHILYICSTTYCFYGKYKVKNPNYKGKSIRNLNASTSLETFHEMSSILKILKNKHLIDSISCIKLTTDNIFDIGMDISAVLIKKGAYRKYIEEAVRNSSIKRKIDNLLLPYNLKVRQIDIPVEFKPFSNPIEDFPIHKLGLNPKHTYPSMFIIIPLTIKLDHS